MTRTTPEDADARYRITRRGMAVAVVWTELDAAGVPDPFPLAERIALALEAQGVRWVGIRYGDGTRVPAP